jgi:hypothetical protein
MKLPNFLMSDDLGRLKRAMGIPANRLGDVKAIEIKSDGVTPSENQRLGSEGLEVDKPDVVALPDGTLSYKNRRILLYIRDITQYAGYFEPRFHLADCITLQQMRENSRFGRFVIASRDDGLFHLHYIDSGKRIDKRLDVCQNCLDRLNYKGFRLSMRVGVRRAAVQVFKIADFFAGYPKTLHHSIPNHTDQTAPTNDYSPDFSSISRAYRQKRNWICETCTIPLSRLVLQRYLDVHHMDGQKNNNEEANLKSVCVHCHALEPSHRHITATLRYRDFEPMWQRWRMTGVAP